MAYFEGQGARWAPQHGRQQSWDPSHGPPRSGSSRGRMPQRYKDMYQESGNSPSLPPEDPSAFLSQYEEIDRAGDNLAKSRSMFGMPGPGRRDSLPPPGPFARQYPEFDPRMATGPPRHHSIGGEFDGMRSHSSHSSSSVQNYLAHQRFPPRVNEQEHMAKRRAAAQRERELRNYHQEQQYNRNLSGAKSERSQSPSGMSEDDRRELIARQHRALYGSESNLYMPDGSAARPMSQDARVMAGAPGAHGSSPMNYDGYGVPTTNTQDAPGPVMTGAQTRSRSNSTSSPAANQSAFAMYESNPAGANPTSSSSPGASPTRGGAKVPSTGGVAPIGTRPLQAKRNTPPMPSPLSHAYTGGNERSQSSASNPTVSGAEKPPGLGWGGTASSGPWGNANNNKAQASVWG